MSNAELMRTGLPINRKERFYTGTVLPAIVCAEDFKFFGRFLGLLGIPDFRVDVTPQKANIQFFTEYSLRESIHTKHDRARFPNPPTARYTPDVLVYLEGEPPYLIAVEAKMFDDPDGLALKQQMDNQRDHVLAGLRKQLKVPARSVIQVALLPEALKKRVGKFGYRVVTWEEVLEEFRKGRDEDYFMRLLRLALDDYDDLVSVVWARGTVPDIKMEGQEIMAQFHLGGFPFAYMGRLGGLSGPGMKADIGSGNWKTHVYPLKKASQPPSQNWFPVEKFVQAVQG